MLRIGEFGVIAITCKGLRKKIEKFGCLDMLLKTASQVEQIKGYETGMCGINIITNFFWHLVWFIKKKPYGQ